MYSGRMRKKFEKFFAFFWCLARPLLYDFDKLQPDRKQSERKKDPECISEHSPIKAFFSLRKKGHEWLNALYPYTTLEEFLHKICIFA